VDLTLQRDQIELAYQLRSRDDFLLFARGLTIPSAEGPRQFDEVMAPFQREFLEQIEPSLKAARVGDEPPRRRWWIERTKGASKDSDLAVCLLWLLAFPGRPLYMQVGAGDRDQAAIVRKRMEDLLYYNGWLAEWVSIKQNKAVNLRPGIAELDILAADAKTAHGGTPDVMVINELTHVDRWDFASNMMSNAAKVPRNLTIVATNAGFRGTKAEVWRRNADASHESRMKKGDEAPSSDWTVMTWTKPAPWILPADVEDERRRSPSAGAFNRLWYGVWASGKGDALDEEDIDRCMIRQGPIVKPEVGWNYVAGLDLGISHDHAGLAVLGSHAGLQKVRLAWMRGFAPIKVGEGRIEVDLMAVEEECYQVFRQYNLRWFGYDPAAGGSYMAQRLRNRQCPMQEVSFSSQTNMSLMATTLVQSMKEGRLECYDDEGRLRRDLGKFNIVERTKGTGFKLEATRDEHGHADVGTALVIALPRAVQLLYWTGLMPDDVVAGGEESELTEEEVAELPGDLKELYE